MTAGATSCSCTVCGTVCTGRFAGCAAVWARGPREVAVDAPHFTRSEITLQTSESENRWRLPLDSLNRPAAPMRAAAAAPAEEAAPSNGARRHAVAEPAHEHETVFALADDDHERDHDHEPTGPLEAPDITARFAVAQLAELNERVEAIAQIATDATGAGLEKVHAELRRLTSLREVDLTEQAAGIFGAVQAGSDALESFAAVVREVTDDLRAILTQSLTAIGGAEGLAARVAEAQDDVASVREDFGAALARIERDLSVMRQRIPAKAGGQIAAKISRDQLDYIVDAVSEAVIGTLNAERATGRRR